MKKPKPNKQNIEIKETPKALTHNDIKIVISLYEKNISLLAEVFKR